MWLTIFFLTFLFNIFGGLCFVFDFKLYYILWILLFLIFVIIQRKESFNFLLKTEICLILNGIAMIIYPKIFSLFLPIITSIYIFILGIVSLLVCVGCRKSRMTCIMFFMKSLMLFAFAFLIKFSDYNKLFFIKIAGVYLIIAAFICTIYILRKKKIGILFHLPLPLTLYKPTHALSKFKNNYIANNSSYNAQIFIHATKKGISKYGHIDLFFKEKIISFGSYDRNSEKLFGAFGDGMIYVVENKEKYIDFLNKYSNKTIFAFGINLNEKQYEEIESKIESIFKIAERWVPPAYYYNDFKKYDNDYASNLQKNTNAQFYKIKTGCFKIYSTFYTNCVMFVNFLVGKDKLNPLNLGDLITPGVYFDYLNRQLKKKGSCVLGLEVYVPNGRG